MKCTSILNHGFNSAFLASVALAFCAGCPQASPDPTPQVTGPVSFANHIQPIFDASCTRCHAAGGFAEQQGIPLKLTAGDSHAMLVNQHSVQNAALVFVVPGDSAASLLNLKITQNNPPVGQRMPLDRFFGGRSPTNAENELVRRWIDEGALNN
jgi:hypothetical protein